MSEDQIKMRINAFNNDIDKMVAARFNEMADKLF